MSQASSNSVVNELLSGLEEDTQTEQVKEVQEEAEETKEEVKEESKEPLITKEMAKQHGLATWMVGKPVSELGKAYENLRADYQKKATKISELEKKMSQFEQQMLSQAKTREEKAEVKDIFEDMPDPVEELPKFKAWMKNVVSMATTDAEKKAIEKIQGQVGQIEAYNQQQKEQQLFNELKDTLPEVDLDEVIVAWGQDLGIIGDETEIARWLNNPERMKKSIIAFQKSREYDVLKSKTDKEIGDEVVKKTAKTLQSKKEVKASDLNSQSRRETKSNAPKVVQDILEDLE